MSGDKFNTLGALATLAAQHGMIWVGLDLSGGRNTGAGSEHDLNRLGNWLGAMAQANADQGPEVAPPAADLRTAFRLGERVSGNASLRSPGAIGWELASGFAAGSRRSRHPEIRMSEPG